MPSVKLSISDANDLYWKQVAARELGSLAKNLLRMPDGKRREVIAAMTKAELTDFFGRMRDIAEIAIAVLIKVPVGSEIELAPLTHD